jgi:hypothetical protein
VFDADFFFGRSFHDRVQAFLLDNEQGSLRVEVVTLTGDRLDTLRLDAVEKGARLYTREDRLVFMPYEHIAHIEVSILQDFRIPGFQLATSAGSSAESGAERRLLAASVSV